MAAHHSTKNEVVDTIGLPRRVEQSADGELEVWYYTGKPISTSYFVPLPVSRTSLGAGMDLVHYADVGAKNVIDDQPVVLVCTFNRAGQLVNISHPEKNR